MNMRINIKKLNVLAEVPLRGSNDSAGYDLYAATSYIIEVPPHSTVKVGTGWAMDIPSGYFGAVFARSGLATKEGLRPANCVGVIDPDYRGEIMVAVHNDTDTVRFVNPGERIAQIVFMPFISAEFVSMGNLEPTVRGSGGFGSTGVN